MRLQPDRPRIPGATYRLQLTGGSFGFAAAAEIIDYLDALGVDALYVSPILAARPGSTSGYDLVDPCRLDPGLGTEAELLALGATLRSRGMGLILDIVPNHMAARWENRLWADVLARGRRSEHASVFDIDWDSGPALPGEEPRLVLAVLGAPFAEVLERGELCVVETSGGPALRYHDHLWPLAPGTATPILSAAGHPDAAALAAVLDAQVYQLAHFRMAAHKVNYRRFFDITDLVGVRVEDPDVFDLTHSLILLLARRDIITGLRIDHIDGLRDPQEYLDRLRRSLPATGQSPDFYVIVEKILSADEPLRQGWPVHGTTGYEFARALAGVFVDPGGLQTLEEIYARFLGFEHPFHERLYQQKKRVIQDLFRGLFRGRGAELCRLAMRDSRARDLLNHDIEQALIEITACFPVYRTYIRSSELHPDDRRYVAAAVDEARARNVLVPAAAYDFVERVLTLDMPAHATPAHQRAWLDFVLRWQQSTGPVMAKGLEDTALYQDFRLLSLNLVGGEPDPRPGSLRVAAFHDHNARTLASWPHSLLATSTHDSKRSEDVRARLHVLADLPTAWGRALARWSNLNAPHKPTVHGQLVPTRNEEVLIYQTLLGAWPLDDAEQDDFVERFIAYLIKASREAKLHTSWLDTNEAYEAALTRFVRAILDPGASQAFLLDFRALQRRVAFHGALNSLSQVVLKVTSPGVPDFYQGTELWTLTLVDPDNRRPVDFPLRRGLLGEIMAATSPGALCQELLDTWQDGRIKLYITQRALRFRRAHGELFARGAYAPLTATGARADAVCAFARSLDDQAGGQWSLTVVPMRVGTLTAPDHWPLGPGCWGDTAVAVPANAPRLWRDVLTGAVIPAGDAGDLPLASVLATLPVALLEAMPAP